MDTKDTTEDELTVFEEHEKYSLWQTYARSRSKTAGEVSCGGFWEAFGAPEGIRTPDPQIRSLVLYPAELPARKGEKHYAPCSTNSSAVRRKLDGA